MVLATRAPADVEFDDVTCSYPGCEDAAVDHLDLRIEPGEFMVLVGPSGSGKSTALRALAGLEEVADGEIRIGGDDVTFLPPRQRDLAMVFQNYALYPHMTVAENIGFPLKLSRVPKAERARRVEEAARALDLTPYLARKPQQLSGGQRQRVAMGRSIVRQPRAFLMDEPLSNLDAKLRVQTRSEIAVLQERLGITTLYVTHDQAEAMTMGQRVAVLRDGRLQQVDTPRRIFDHPDNAFVAGFLGSPAMNLFRAPLDAAGANADLVVGEQTLSVAPAVLASAAEAGCAEVLVGVRPEDIDLATGGLPARIVTVEELGSDTYLHCEARVAEDEVRLVVRTGARRSLQRGENVELTLRPEALHLFDPESGLRLGD